MGNNQKKNHEMGKSRTVNNSLSTLVRILSDRFLHR